MANAIASLPGQINQSGDVTAVFLKVFSGETLAAYETANVMASRTMVKTFTSGKSAQWPRFGKASSNYHARGTEILGVPLNTAEIVAPFDDPLVSHIFLSKFDDAMSHFDTRSVYASELGIKIANDTDEFTLIEGLLGARLTAVGNELPTEVPFNGSWAPATNSKFLQTSEVTGGASNSASVEEKIDAISSALFAAAARLDEANVPQMGRYLIVRPREFRQFAEAVQSNGFSLTNTDYGTSGSVSMGKVFSIAGFDIVMSNLLPNTNVGTTGRYQFHGGDFSKTVGLIGQTNAIGMGKLYDLAVDQAWDFRRRGWLYIAELAAAFKYLRPESLIELAIDTGSVA